MEKTEPPDLLSYNRGGTNHTFSASPEICSSCHEEAFTRDVQPRTGEALKNLQDLIENSLLALMADQIVAGNTIDLNGQVEITDVGQVKELVFGESHGRQAITVILTDDTVLGPFAVTDVDVKDGDGTVLGNLYDLADPRLAKAGWNWNLINNDGSLGVHNPGFAFRVLDASVNALIELR